VRALVVPVLKYVFVIGGEVVAAILALAVWERFVFILFIASASSKPAEISGPVLTPTVIQLVGLLLWSDTHHSNFYYATSTCASTSHLKYGLGL
jgi:hypothetical protein